MTTPRTKLLSTVDIASMLKIPRHAVDKLEQQAIKKLLDAILSDQKIIDRYGGCLIEISNAIIQELNIDMKLFVKCASHSIIKKFWTI